MQRYILAFAQNVLILAKDDFLIFWNNRNARRKQSGSLIYWFDSFLKQLKKKHPGATAKLLMHTEPNDPNGQDLFAICSELGLAQTKEVLISTDKVPPSGLSMLYNCADVTVNIADAEGFGLATFESMSCETPIIVTMTGGLQEQVTKLATISHDDMVKRNLELKPITEYEHGIGLEPSSKAIIGSQDVPFIYEDRLNEKQVIEALFQMYEYGAEKRAELGKAGRQHVLENYGYEDFAERWIELMLNTYKKHGSWKDRKNYNRWELRAI